MKVFAGERQGEIASNFVKRQISQYSFSMVTMGPIMVWGKATVSSALAGLYRLL